MEAMKVPVWGRCTFCHSYQPRIILECQTEDDYSQLFRFFCDAACHANWGTNQPRPPVSKAKRKPVVAKPVVAKPVVAKPAGKPAVAKKPVAKKPAKKPAVKKLTAYALFS